MKPVNKAEGRWKFWRSWHPKDDSDHLCRWAKKQMAKARRRFNKKEATDEGEVKG